MCPEKNRAMKSRESLIYDMVRREVREEHPDAGVFEEAYLINRLLVEKFGPKGRDQIIDKVYQEMFGDKEE